MVKLLIKTYEMKFDADRCWTTTDCIKHVLDLPPAGGFTPDIMRKSDRIDKAILVIKDNELTLEDQDIDFLKQRTEVSRWPFRNKDLTDFLDAIKDLKPDKK
jgi:hypothetical protein